MECYEKALEINLENDETWANKGVLLRKLGKYEEALECFEKALEINPEFADAWKWKGIILEDLKKPEESLKCYKKALKLNPPKQNTMVHARKNTTKTRQTQRSTKML